MYSHNYPPPCMETNCLMEWRFHFPTFSHTYDLKYIITLQVNSRNDSAFNLAFSIKRLPKKTLIAQFKLPWKPWPSDNRDALPFCSSAHRQLSSLPTEYKGQCCSHCPIYLISGGRSTAPLINSTPPNPTLKRNLHIYKPSVAHYCHLGFSWQKQDFLGFSPALYNEVFSSFCLLVGSLDS